MSNATMTKGTKVRRPESTAICTVVRVRKGTRHTGEYDDQEPGMWGPTQHWFFSRDFVVV